MEEGYGGARGPDGERFVNVENMVKPSGGQYVRIYPESASTVLILVLEAMQCRMW